jgi:SAM-dependent methyltransferase
MDDYQADTYGERIAGVYDSMYSEYDPKAVNLLKELAGKGPALELGIGTGRIALPLVETGLEVHGIDASPAMVEKLRSKPGGDRIPVTLGDFASLPVEGEYSLIYVLANTFFCLLTQYDQLLCLENVVRHLKPDGLFLIAAFMPDLNRYIRGQTVTALDIKSDSVQLDIAQLDPVRQLITVQHVHMSEAGLRLYPVKLRYVWPSELDLMARLAGLRLAHRWGDWEKSPFTESSGRHVSVFSLSTQQ